MKIQDYGKVVSRMHTREHLKQEVINMAIEKQARRPRINAIGLTAAAVAAVCLGVNGLFAYSIIKMHNQPDISSQMPAASSELNNNLPVYNLRANELFTALSGKEFSKDLTAYGKELDFSYDYNGYTLQFTGILGSEYALYWFYDVIPQAGQTWEQFQQDCKVVQLRKQQDFSVERGRSIEPRRISGQGEDDAWHCYGTILSMTGESLAGRQYSLELSSNLGPVIETDCTVTVDFVQPSQHQQLQTPFVYPFIHYPDTTQEIGHALISPFGIVLNKGYDCIDDYSLYGGSANISEIPATVTAVMNDGTETELLLNEDDSFQAELWSSVKGDFKNAAVQLVFAEPVELADIQYFELSSEGSCIVPVTAEVPDSTEGMQMPALIGMSLSDAQQMFGGQIQIQVERREYSTVEEGRIFDQSIPANAPVVKGDTVQVAVSLGIAKVVLPDVRKWNFEQAKDTIENLGLDVEKCMSYSDDVEEGIVISTDPQGPAELKPGTKVRVQVSLGKTATTVKVPNFLSMNWDLARETADAMGLYVQREDVDDNSPAGTVLYQDYNAGEEVASGSVITLRVSTGSPLWTDVRIAFKIPENANGLFCITLYQDGFATAVGGEFNPVYASGVTSVIIAGSGAADVTAVLRNDETGAEANIGTYHVDFDHKTWEPLSEDIAAAYAAVGGLS